MPKQNYIKIAKRSTAIQIAELKKINKTFNKSFIQAINVISNCKFGKIIFTGQGKSGKIAASASSTMSSFGIPSFFVHPSEVPHGDSGSIQRRDVLIIISYSGNTRELQSVISHANRFGIKIIGCSSNKASTLLKHSDVKILLPKVREVGPTGMVPTSSTALTLLYFNCLAVALMDKIKFSKDKFKKFHSSGSIGQNLASVHDVMLKGNRLPLINYKSNILKAIQIINKKKLGLGIIVKNKLAVGIVTDGDIRRKFSRGAKKDKINTLMTKKPLYINESASAHKGLSIMSNNLITSLLVSSDGDYKKNKIYFKPKGILHIHSLLKYGIK
jgi:arabinose-5-phosphate isomerase